MQGLVGYAEDAPLGEDMGADLFVEGDGGGVPGENVPLETGAALGQGELGEVLEEGSADSLPSVGGGDVEIFQAKAVMAAPGAIAGEEEGEAGRDLIQFSEDAAEARDGAETVAEEVGLGGEDGVRLALVQGKLADEAENGRHVFRRGGADVEEGAQLGFSGVWPFGVAGSGVADLSGFSSVSGGDAGFLAAGLGWASSHLSKGRVKAKSSCFLPFESV